MLHINIIYIDDKKDSRITGITLQGDTDEATVVMFLDAKTQHNIETMHARFLAYLTDDKGDIHDAMAMDSGTFQALTGKKPLTDQAYIEIDREFHRLASRE
jgi:hypothetical protein